MKCDNCKNKGWCCDGDHEIQRVTCITHKNYLFIPITNADRIRAMSDEELAEWLADILNHCENKKPEELCRMSCPLYKCCNYQPSDNIEDWLKAPADKEGGVDA